jgi:hypothetical protein
VQNSAGAGAGLANGIAPAGAGGASAGTVTLEGAAGGKKQQASCACWEAWLVGYLHEFDTDT